jgi:hypothetical protein
MQAAISYGHARTTRIVECWRKLIQLALSPLWSCHGVDAETQRRRNLAVQLLRFVITRLPARFQTRAHSMATDKCAQLPLSTLVAVRTLPSHHPKPISPTLLIPQTGNTATVGSINLSSVGTEAATNPHRPRPPQNASGFLLVSLSKMPRR